jgi:hypothetical protein
MNEILMTTVDLNELFERIRTVVKEELLAERTRELNEKLLSPKETCEMFHPKITTATLKNWTDDGLIQDHWLGGRKFYKYSEILKSLVTLKRYKRAA